MSLRELLAMGRHLIEERGTDHAKQRCAELCGEPLWPYRDDVRPADWPDEAIPETVDSDCGPISVEFLEQMLAAT